MVARAPVRTRRAAGSTETQEAVMTVMSSGVGIAEEKRKVLEVRQFVTDPAFVRVNAGVTKNLGNYESLRVDVAITTPCYVEEIDKTQKRIAAMVADMLDAEVTEYLGEKG